MTETRFAYVTAGDRSPLALSLADAAEELWQIASAHPQFAGRVTTLALDFARGRGRALSAWSTEDHEPRTVPAMIAGAVAEEVARLCEVPDEHRRTFAAQMLADVIEEFARRFGARPA